MATEFPSLRFTEKEDFKKGLDERKESLKKLSKQKDRKHCIRSTRGILRSLNKLQSISCIPSLIIRALNDKYIEKSSPYENNNEIDLIGIINNIWDTAGLRKSDALYFLESFISCGSEAADLVNREYFYMPRDKIANQIKKDLSKSNIEKYVENSLDFSPVRIFDAVTNQDPTKLTKRDTEFIKTSTGYEDENTSLILKHLKNRRDFRWPTSRTSRMTLPKKLESYKFDAEATHYQLLVSKDHGVGKADPVFTFHPFFTNPLSGERNIQITKVIRLGDNLDVTDDWVTINPEAHMPQTLGTQSNTQAEGKQIYYYDEGDNLLPGSYPEIIITALEDDHWLDEGVIKLVDWAIKALDEIASQTANPYLEAAVLIIKISWEIVKLIQSLDKDDEFYPHSYQFLEETFPVDLWNDYLFEEIDGDNRWMLRLNIRAFDEKYVAPFFFVRSIDTYQEFNSDDLEIITIVGKSYIIRPTMYNYLTHCGLTYDSTIGFKDYLFGPYQSISDAKDARTILIQNNINRKCLLSGRKFWVEEWGNKAFHTPFYLKSGNNVFDHRLPPANNAIGFSSHQIRLVIEDFGQTCAGVEQTCTFYNWWIKRYYIEVLRDASSIKLLSYYPQFKVWDRAETALYKIKYYGFTRLWKENLQFY